MEINRKKRVLVVPNEDGAGPSALVSHVVRHLLKKSGETVEVTVWNRSRLAFNRNLYRDLPGVRVEPVWNLIQLSKDMDTGRVSLPGTLELLKGYGTLRERYPGDAVSGPWGFDAVLDFGVPHAARWAERMGIPSVSLFDHSWSRTLQMILDERRGDFTRRETPYDAAWERLVRTVREDEAAVRRLFVFPPFITPGVFRRHWEEIGVNPRDTGAVFGGRPARTREEAQAFLGLSEPGKTVLVLGGDTPVWDSVLLTLCSTLEAEVEELERLALNLLIYMPYRLLDHPVVRALDRVPMPRVQRLEQIPGGTLQDILPAVDLLVTRAGGGTVNDAVACRVPFVCVPERTQPQVQAILDACLEQGLTRILEERAFREDPAAAVLTEAGRIGENRSLVERMQGVPIGGEAVVAQAVLDLLPSG